MSGHISFSVAPHAKTDMASQYKMTSNRENAFEMVTFIFKKECLIVPMMTLKSTTVLMIAYLLQSHEQANMVFYSWTGRKFTKSSY